MTCEKCNSLREEIEYLRSELDSARARIGFLQRHPTIAKGSQGESYIAEVTGLHTTRAFSEYDLGGNGSPRLEIKYSSLRPTKKGGRVMRWAWAKLLGQSGLKVYDRLILIGDQDPRFSAYYLDPSTGLVIFDIPFADIDQFASGAGTAGIQIRLCSNPISARGKSALLFLRYQINEAELSLRYKM